MNTTYEQVVVELMGASDNSIQITTKAWEKVRQSRAKNVRATAYHIGDKKDKCLPFYSGYNRIIKRIQNDVLRARKFQAAKQEVA